MSLVCVAGESYDGRSMLLWSELIRQTTESGPITGLHINGSSANCGTCFLSVISSTVMSPVVYMRSRAMVVIYHEALSRSSANHRTVIRPDVWK